ncbi:WD40/YVTN/BNR-like repeat-containing protein [Winogradskyella aurantia]|uniref:Glycosyl hydrolase n=1 Tax=Winogradskyella aurantia TaxID=1915063 RepID=A0A265US72_9FLAO|nr:glycosyl hydrolase [Winogradskyella aurantia]OZV68146.1 glycosyl hydrolase [Winogradskyella aurantia]
MKKITFTLLCILMVGATFAQSLDSIFKSVKYRNIGPFRGGRSVAASGVVGNPMTYYMGNTGGGLWKTEDGGQLWTNISDGYFKTSSVGAIAVSESDSNIVYVGMGEHAPRAVMTSYGDGVYKSNDAGKTWRHVGLKATQHISRIVIHPKNPDILFVAAQGALYGPNTDRGVFKSVDGGATWTKVLYVNDLTGCAELSMDHNNPLVMYAAMWEHQRLPWKVISGGAGSGLYKTTDGGETWNKIHEGLPKEKGKMAIAVSRSNSDKVYALVESDSDKELGGLFVSNNAGEQWSKVSSDHSLIQRAWYYIELFIDPNDEEKVYVLNASAQRSIDGGKTWSTITGTHGDYHDLWINPDNSNNMVIANDGGAAVSYNYAKTWSPQNRMATAQFYRVNTDNLFPYNLYGGQQDNTSVKISSLALGSGGIDVHNWSPSAGGESAFLAFDPDNPRYVMGGSYLGTIEILDTKAKASTQIMAAPIQYLGRDGKDMKYRYNWNAPIIKSQHEPNTYYHGAQVLLRTRDNGITWEEVSPDLSNNEKEKQGKGGGPYTNEAVGAENYGTLAYVVESPHEKGIIWAATDDGVLQLTKNGGETWDNVTPKGLPETLINAIEVSPHDKATAYIATTRFKFNDYTPAIYKTTNYGKSWTNISSGIPQGAYTRVVREDTKRKDLLFAGTELGMYISWNGGKEWQSFQLNLPVTPITDLKVSHDDLSVATMGRSFWILDDIGLLRQFEGTAKAFTLLQPEDAIIGNWGSQLNSNSERFVGTDDSQGVNPANGVVLYYFLPADLKDEVLTLVIKDKDGNVVRTFSSKTDSDFIEYPGGPSPEPVLSTKAGLNRFVWDMRHTSLPGAPTAYIEGSFRGHKAIPNAYTASLKQDDKLSSVTFNILPNPLYDTTQETYKEFHDFQTQAEASFTEMHLRVNKLKTVQDQVVKILRDLPKEEKYSQVKSEGEALLQKLKSWDEDMVQRKSKAYDDVENFPNKFTAEYLFLINQNESSLPKVNQASRDRRAELDKQWEGLKRISEELIKEAIPAYNKLLWNHGIGALNIK